MRNGLVLIVLSLLFLGFYKFSFSQILSPNSSSTTYRGDINEDGQVNIFDLLGLLGILAKEPESDRQREIANVDKSADGNVNIFDLLGMLSLLSGSSEPDLIRWGPAITGLNRDVVAVGDTLEIYLENIGETVTSSDVKAFLGGTEINHQNFTITGLQLEIPDWFTGGELILIIASDTTNMVYCNYQARGMINQTLGGTVEHFEGYSVTIPAGAIQEDSEIFIEVLSKEKLEEHGIPEDTNTTFLSIGPSDINLSEKAVIALPWPENSTPGDSFDVQYYNLTNMIWKQVEVQNIDSTKRLVFALTYYFGIFKTNTKLRSLQGYVVECVAGLSGADISVIGANIDTVLVTDSEGKYDLSGLKGGEFIITPTKEGYSFSPESVSVTVDRYISEADIIVGYDQTLPIQMVCIPGGAFNMGEVGFCVGSCDDQPVHKVTLNGFLMSKYEITISQYVAYLNSALDIGDIEVTSSEVKGVKTHPGQKYYDLYYGATIYKQMVYSNGRFSVPEGLSNYPVNYLTWYGADAFAQYYGLSLPTEAEWEYACRAGTTTRFYWGSAQIDDRYVIYVNNSINSNNPIDHPYGSFPVGTKLPNAFGLYDMSGNVQEWCNDYYDWDYYSSSPSNNPTGPRTGYHRVVRGGGWADGNQENLRSAGRHYLGPLLSYPDVGFRVVRR